MCSMTRSSGLEKAIRDSQAVLVSNKFVLGSEVQDLKCHREHTENSQRTDREQTGKPITVAPLIAVPMEHRMERTKQSWLHPVSPAVFLPPQIWAWRRKKA